MNKFWFIKGFKALTCILAAAFVMGYVVQLLWNWLMPVLFKTPYINLWQAIGLLALSKILFGKFGWDDSCHDSSKKAHWKDRFKKKVKNMTPEERERFKQTVKGKWCSDYVCDVDDEIEEEDKKDKNDSW